MTLVVGQNCCIKHSQAFKLNEALKALRRFENIGLTAIDQQTGETEIHGELDYALQEAMRVANLIEGV